MKKCGFTLIELLAVITILGIIALIAVPTVNNIVEDAKVSTFRVTLNNLSRKVEENCTIELLENKKITTNYIIKNGKISTPLDIKGDIPDGEINVDNDCNVNYELTNHSYVGLLNKNDEEVTINKCNGICLSYSEPILNDAKPELDSKMLPVTIETDGTVKKANRYSEWYSYENKKWANSVLVTDESRPNYQNAKAGEIIKSADIIGHFVWIPRYKYKIPTGGTSTPSSIDIIFEKNTTLKSIGNASDEYLTHPGFTFGSDELNGIWAAKFETTGTASKPTILPNVTSLRYQTFNIQQNTALKFNNYVSSRDAHIMKNTEWGAVAYLSHSIYGINKEIRINNNNGFITGCGGNEDSAISTIECQIKYGKEENLPQSTTGNITGIFDMSGGAWDRVMGNYDNNIATSELPNMPDEKYYDKYTSTDYKSGCNGQNCLGHANSETKNWYDDYCFSLSTSLPWVHRGGNYNNKINAGVFNSGTSNGNASTTYSFRVTIS